MEQTGGKRKLVHNPDVPNRAGTHEGPSNQVFINKLIKKSIHFRDAVFLDLVLGPRPGKETKGNKRNIKGNRRKIKGN